MFGTLFGMYVFHRRERDKEREKRIQYWREQVRHLFFQASPPLMTPSLSECLPSKHPPNARHRNFDPPTANDTEQPA
jgi:hypothetical protein